MANQVEWLDANGNLTGGTFAEFEKFRNRELGALEKKVAQAKAQTAQRVQRQVAQLESKTELTGIARAVAARIKQLESSAKDPTKRV